MNDWLGIVWLAVLLLVNAFFVGSEFAVIAARRSQIEPRAEAGSTAAKTALWAMEHVTLMLATCQLGITVASLLILNVSEPSIHHLLEVPLVLLRLPEEVIGTVAFIITLIVVSFLHAVLGEIVPKNLSFSLPDRLLLILATPLVAVATVFRPIIVVLNVTTDGILRLFRVEPRSEANTAFTMEEVATIVATSTREGVLTDVTGTLSNAFEFTEKTVRDVTVGMKAIVTLPEDAAPADVERAVAQHGFSRYVLVDEEGEPTGYVHLKDVIDLDEDEYNEPVPPKRIRQLISVFRDQDLEDALATLRRSGSHVARVFDESGGTKGVLFLEDIIEELVGEVQDATRRQP
jgi:CBS domain containing-hemolysin-like protein